ncbi:MAG TPA: hypothetical protein VGN07_22520 [Steroidobacteraceae bacterium]|jgi:hypothetical protein
MYLQLFASSPVKPIPLAEALKISLDNYYALLKIQVGSFQANEFLQLKLVADILDISGTWPANAPAGAHFYPWHSVFLMLDQADRQIVPAPIVGGVESGAERMTNAYGTFLQKLMRYVVTKDLTLEQQASIANWQQQIRGLNDQSLSLAMADRQKWNGYALAMGLSPTDASAYLQWSGQFGSQQTIAQIYGQVKQLQNNIQMLYDSVTPDPSDKEIVDTYNAFNNPLQRLRYPLYEDFLYDTGRQFSPGSLGGLPLGDTAQFSDRRAVTFDPFLDSIKTGAMGHFTAHWDRTTQQSSEISTDWKASGSGGWGPFGASVSVEDSKKITNDFKTVTSIDLAAAAAFRAKIVYPTWFNPTLFSHQHVKDNISDFAEFFGTTGSLLYYATALILVRGFSAGFANSQAWTYDYKEHFSASGSAGFNCLGYNFGASAAYSSDVHEHQVDIANTTLSFSDDAATVRFVGYAVKKVTVMEESLNFHFRRSGLY